MEKIIKKLNFNLLKKEIENYGFQFSFKQFLTSTGLSFFAITMIAYMSKIKMIGIIALIILTIIVVPFMILAQFTQMYQINRFEQLINYLDNIIPIFKHNPKIFFALKEVEQLCEGKMKDAVSEALSYISNNTSDDSVYENALKIIENEFPNSRVKSIHKMMITIENESSSNYYNSVDNMYYDVQAWIGRTYTFQKELMNRKRMLIIFSVVTVLMNCGFVYMMTSNDFFKAFTDNIIFQLSTTIFISCIVIVIALVSIKMNGKWLVDDSTKQKNKSEWKAYQYIRSNNKKRKNAEYIMMFLLFLSACFFFNKGAMYLVVLCACAICVLMFQKKITFHTKKNIVIKAIKIEFPIWLREISLNLQNFTTFNAIGKSREMCSEIMKEEIDVFLKKAHENPVSIVPYDEFLQGFDIPEVRSNMKVLYSLQNIDENEMNNQVNSLIIRNQDLLATGEQIKNKDAISGIELLGFIPTGMLILQLLINMGLTFGYMMGIMNQAMQTGIVG